MFLRRSLFILCCFITLPLSPGKAQESPRRPDSNLQPASVIDQSLDPCRYFNLDEPMVGFFVEMGLEDQLVPMRVPKRYLEDRFDHIEGAVHGAQLFRISVPTFEPITRQETGRRNAAGLPWDWMNFLVNDQLPLDQTIGLQLTLPITYADIGKPRSVPDVHDFPNEPGPYGLIRVVAPDRLGGEDLFVQYDDEQNLTTWILCQVQGINFTKNELCSLETRLSGMDVSMSFRRTELANWKIIYRNVAQFLTCATSEKL